MRALDRKLLRDLWEMRGMVLAIALVLTGGVATFVMSLSTYDSLTLTQASYYRENRFAQVFASLKRAPENVAGRIRALPGVDKVETRVVEASFLFWHEDKVLQLPTSALFRHGDAWAVFVVGDGRAVRRSVEIGQRSGLIAQPYPDCRRAMSSSPTPTTASGTASA